MLEMCIEKELVIANNVFKKKDIHKYTWVRGAYGRIVDRALMDYVVVSKRVRGRVMDVNVLRGETGGISDHFLVDGRWRHRKGEGCGWAFRSRSAQILGLELSFYL